MSIPISYPDLPFCFECPTGCQVRRKSNPLNPSEPSVVITREYPKFFLNLIWGSFSGPHGAPPSFRVVEKRELPTPKGETNILIARGPLLSPPYVFVSIFWGVIVGLALFLLLRAQIGFMGVFLGAGAAVILVLVYVSLISGPSVKYAFVYDNVEYAFTGSWRQRGQVDECITSLKFLR
jgi:hypothetical protein